MLTQPPARLGTQLVLGCSALVTATAWAVVPDERLSRAYLVTGLAIVISITVRRIPGMGTDGVRCLPFPLLLLVELFGLGLLGPSAVQPYLAMVPLAFIYVGLTCRPNRSWWLIPPACAAWLIAYEVPAHGPDAQVFIRLPISMVVWVLIAELLSRYVAAVGNQAESLADDAVTDVLTGLPNRRALGPVLIDAGPGDALVMLDVDHFRSINEQHGHAGGDAILRRLGAVVRSSLRGDDTALRYGGEEILLRLSGIGDLTALEQTLHRLQTAWREVEPTVTFSGGGVILAPGSDTTAALRVADACLYEAKVSGRNRVRLRDLGSNAGELEREPVLRL